MSDHKNEPRLFVWYFANPVTETTYKIYVIAHDAAEARRMLDMMPGSQEERIFYRNTMPTTYRCPWAEVNVSRNGKAVAWAYGKSVGDLS